ncbi:lipase [Tritrichomonas foetus]|uniref:Lipase n=1 Tax=Tritrichomonas foetus TaxID=1144522 RepID=A0A1J4KKS4_9EUKA|nr:lipase [Tritrichomonas foetus]|eukprot:OHT09973.1 lipase [Tritrichomonas foetus]
MRTFQSSFLEVDEIPGSVISDPESAQFVASSQYYRSSQDDIEAVDLAMKGDSTKLNKLRGEQKVNTYEEGVDHADRFVYLDSTNKILVRHYYPHGTNSVKNSENSENSPECHKGGFTNLPILIFIHGGGWIYSSVEQRNQFCSLLSKTKNIEVASINYSLSPEAECGKSLDESHAVWEEVTANSDSNRMIFLSGDSSGGNLAAGLVHLILEKNLRLPTALLLLYPVLDLVNEYPSYKIFGNGYGLQYTVMRKYIDGYCPDIKRRNNPSISPLLGELNHFPPTLVITCQFDILRNEGYAFAKKLDQAGVPVKYVCVESAVHGFFSKPFLTKINIVGHKILNEFLDYFLKQ